MTAAFELSSGDWRSRFDAITVYQVGWRLGGKGASGRGPAPDFAVEEHGLHVWFGFYENAFRMMRRCYEELGRSPDHPLATVDDAFRPAQTFVVQERRPDGWIPWETTFPENERRPGVPDDLDDISLLECVREALHLAASLISTPVPAEHGPPTRSSLRPGPSVDSGLELVTRPARGPLLAAVRRELGSAWRRVEPDARNFAHAALAVALELADEIDEDASEAHGRLAEFVERAADWAKRYLRHKVAMSEEARRDWYVADILMACVRGVLRQGLLTGGLDLVDDYEFTDWLILHGADEESARSAIVRTIVYDLPFAYNGGSADRPECSAATALGGLARLFFTYKGSIAWKMNAGMGDVVFAPLFEVLRRRGVRFEFFHRVDKLHLSGDGKRISSIDITKQVELAAAAGGTYEPLIDVPHGPPAPAPGDAVPGFVGPRPLPAMLPCWPAAPKAELIEDGDSLVGGTALLEQSVAAIGGGGSTPVAPDPADRAGDIVRLDVADDIVVLGISLGALGSICSELVAHDRRWADMVTNVGTVQTQSFQLWLSEPMSTLLGSDGSDHLGTSSLTLGGYLEPFDTYADMTHLRAAEGRAATRSIAYFTNVLPTCRGSRAEAVEQVKANALRFLRDEMVPLWPGAVDRYPTDFRWELLVLPDGVDDVEGVARLEHQFFTANIDLSDGYVLSLPGTIRYRLDPGDSGFVNLFLAGDWTNCDINAGCVEAAVISGLLAVCAVKDEPTDGIVGHRFHRPRREGS